MARQARKRSSTGIYHVMLRGIDRKDIFLDDEDRTKFLESIIKAKKKGKFKIYGYCLMDNHIHMLIKEDEEIGKIIKRITVGYVGWHNKRHERTGHLFQNRYLSEPVEAEDYFITVLRYIHQNPIKAGIVSSLSDYKWSSYDKYHLGYQGQKSFISIDLAEAYFKTFKEFRDYMKANNSDKCLEYNIIRRHNDKTLREIINKKYDVFEIDRKSIKKRNKVICKIYDEQKTSIRQLSRVLGVGKTVVERAIKQDS